MSSPISAGSSARVNAAEIGWPLWLILALCSVFWLLYSYGYIEDDAFIHLEFARSLSEGAGFSFNGARVNGDTAPLWVILLAGIHACGLGWIGAAKLLCTIGVMVAATGIWRVAIEMAGGDTRHRYLPHLTLFLTMVNPYFVHWSFSGMEAVLALGVSLWAMWATFSVATNLRRLTVGALLLSIAPLLRPELVLLAGISGPILLLRAWRLAGVGPLRRSLLIVATLGFVMSIPTLLWVAYATREFGSALPTTNAAKRGGDLLSVGAKMISVYAVGFGATLVAAVLGINRILRRPLPMLIWILLAWPLVCMAFYLVNHTAVQTRYCLLSMPSLTIAALWMIEETFASRLSRLIVAGMSAASLAVVGLIVAPHVTNKLLLVKSVSTAAAFIRESIPDSAPVAVFSIGQLAFETRHPLIDIGGITRPGVLPFIQDQAATLRWAWNQGARYYIGGEPPTVGAELVFSYPMPYMGWTFDRSKYADVGRTGIYRLSAP